MSTPALAGPTSQPILGGTKTTLGQFPNVVAIQLGQSLCTGTLIDKDWVLTAAHCLQGISPTGARVFFNALQLGQGTAIQSAAVYAKPAFSLNNLGQNDIGLIKLAKSVTDISPVPVNLDPAKVPIGTKVTMVGYGATAQGGSGAGTEYFVEQTSVSCTTFNESDANLLCFNQSAGKGKCVGDSGGPSFAMIDGRMMQVGVTSFGDQNCATFGADTRTDAEKAFLLQYIPQLFCTTDADCTDGRTCFMNKCIAQPFGPKGLGSTCTTGADCDSGQCASAGDDSFCSMGCAVGNDSTCPDGLECQNAGNGGACWPAEEGGCCDASGQNAASMLLGMLMFGLVLGRKRRRS